MAEEPNLVEIRFNAPTKHTLEFTDVETGEEHKLPGRGIALVSERQAEELATAPYADVDILDELPETAEDLAKHNTRPVLEALARESGVSSPEDLPNKAAIAAAIVEAESSHTEPEAESGEGQKPESTKED